ncbi:MAG: hypothetical protein ACK5QX_04475 [bacterium]
MPFVPVRQGGKVQEAVRVEKAHAVGAHRVAHVEEPPEVQLFGPGRLAKAAEVMRGKECDAPALRKVPQFQHEAASPTARHDQGNTIAKAVSGGGLTGEVLDLSQDNASGAVRERVRSKESIGFIALEVVEPSDHVEPPAPVHLAGE